MPAARRAKFFATSISSATIQAVASARWPDLERLEIRFCGRQGNTEADFHDVRPLLVRSDMPLRSVIGPSGSRQYSQTGASSQYQSV